MTFKYLNLYRNYLNYIPYIFFLFCANGFFQLKISDHQKYAKSTQKSFRTFSADLISSKIGRQVVQFWYQLWSKSQPQRINSSPNVCALIWSATSNTFLTKRWTKKNCRIILLCDSKFLSIFTVLVGRVAVFCCANWAQRHDRNTFLQIKTLVGKIHFEQRIQK